MVHKENTDIPPVNQGEVETGELEWLTAVRKGCLLTIRPAKPEILVVAGLTKKVLYIFRSSRSDPLTQK
jgi:hypothetical protein